MKSTKEHDSGWINGRSPMKSSKEHDNGWTNGRSPMKSTKEYDSGWTNGRSPMKSSKEHDSGWTNGRSPMKSTKEHDGGWTNGQRKDKVTYTNGNSIVTPFLMCVCPFFAMVFTYTIVELDGKLSNLFQEISNGGVVFLFSKSWLPYLFGSVAAWKLIIPFAVFELLLMRLLPGKLTKGPVTPAGNVPIYKANGLLSFCVTMAMFFLLAYVFKVFNPADVYDHFLEIIGALNLVSLVFCAFLCFKGSYFPSSTDSGGSGSVMFDYYWGSELYPRILGWDVKQFTNCRFGLMSWALLVLCFAAKQQQVYGLSDSMLVSVVLQIIYIAKFFHWEMGYMKTLDIMHDRAGFYLCWGCLVWVPSIYTSHTLYLCMHPNHLGLPLATLIILTGLAAIYINYDADHQKEIVRNQHGNCSLWGRKVDVIEAKYWTSEGEERKSLLLASGWWGISRHFHYIPEILAAFCWSVPALFASVLPYLYFVFVVILLVHRSVRDDKRCLEKYGSSWLEYRKKVPYKIVPFLF